MSINYINLISTLKCALRYNREYIYINKTKLIINIITLLHTYTIINNYKLYGNKILVRLNLSTIISINIISKPSHIKHIPYNKLINNNNTLIILSTNRGILNIDKAIHYRLGGIHLFNISYVQENNYKSIYRQAINNN